LKKSTQDAVNVSGFSVLESVFVNLSMTDGTEVELRLVEGGYVGYSVFNWGFAEAPEDTFAAIDTSCGGTNCDVNTDNRTGNKKITCVLRKLTQV